MVEKYADRWFVGRYRHLQPFPQGNLYLAIRREMNLSQRVISRLFGVTDYQWRYRERTKRMYHVAEVMALYEMSGVTWDRFGEILKSVA
jgi:hypothetical protein